MYLAAMGVGRLGIVVETFDERNALDLVDKYDVVIDASDNVSTRYMVNDACILRKKPLVSA